MRAYTQVHLCDRVQTEQVVGVDQDSDLDAVAGRERHRGQQFPGPGIFTAQRLQHVAEFRSQRRQQRPGHQFGDPAPSVGILAIADFQRSPVKTPDQVDAVLGEQRAHQTRHEHRIGVDQIGVDEDDDVARGGR